MHLAKQLRKSFVAWQICILSLFALMLTACDINPSIVTGAPVYDSKLNIIPITEVTGSTDTLTQVGLPYQFIAVEEVDGKYINVTNQVTWHTSDYDVAAIKQGQAIGKSKGVTRIHAQLSQPQPRSVGQTLLIKRASNEIELIVKDEPLLVLQINTNEEDHPVGTLSNQLPAKAAQNINAMATYADQTSFDVTHYVDWVSSNITAVTVNNAKARMQAQGSSDVHATFLSYKSNTLPFIVSSATLKSIAIIPAKATTAAESYQQFTAIAHYSDGTNQDVTKHVIWQSHNQTVATINQGEAEALIPGQTQITALLHDKSSEPATLTVSNAQLLQLQITPTKPTINLGSDMFYKVKAIYNDGSTDDISDHVLWESSQPEVSNVIAAYAKGSQVGQTQIRANFKGITSNASTLTVTDHQLLSLQLTPSSVKIAQGTQTDLKVIATYDDDSTLDITERVTWQSNSPDIAFISHGHVAGVAAGNAEITAVFDNMSSNQATVEVFKPTETLLQVTPAIETVAIDGIVNYVAQATFSDENDKIVQDVSHLVAWQSDDNDVATLAHGSAIGVTYGKSKISAQLNSSNNSADLTVSDTRLIKLQVTPALQDLPQGLISQYTAIASYEDGTSEDVTNLVNWSTSDSNIATVYAGEVEASSTGSVVIRATYGDKKSNEARLNVTPEQLMSLYIFPEASEVIAHNDIELQVLGIYSDGSSQYLTQQSDWSSSSPELASVLKGKVSALKAGNVTIRVNYPNVNPKTTQVNIKEDRLKSIAVTPKDIDIVEGTTQQFTAIAHYQTNHTQDITHNDNLSWSSSSPNITISKGGLATGVSQQEGVNITISAIKSPENISTQITANVVSLTLESLAIKQVSDKIPATLAPKSYRQLFAWAKFNDGSEKNVTELVDWHENKNSTIVTINKGKLNTLAPGDVNISANYKNKIAPDFKFTVRKPGNYSCQNQDITIPFGEGNITFTCPVNSVEYQAIPKRTRLSNGENGEYGMVIPMILHSDAKAYCKEKGYRLPKTAEYFALVSHANNTLNSNYSVYEQYGWPMGGYFITDNINNGFLELIGFFNKGGVIHRRVNDTRQSHYWSCIK